VRRCHALCGRVERVVDAQPAPHVTVQLARHYRHMRIAQLHRKTLNMRASGTKHP
jgi:hypothetical protein